MLDQWTISVEYRQKLNQVIREYKSYRKIRPDGNCFYRAYLFGLLESAVSVGQSAVGPLRQKFTELADDCKHEGYDAFAVDDFHDLLDEQFRLLEESPFMSTLETQIFIDSGVDGYLIALMRCICGAALKKWSQDFVPFLPSPHLTVDSFCRSEVDPMFKDCDQVQIVALNRIFEVPIDIVYLDQSQGDLVTHSFGEDQAQSLKVTMLYKPGHYDILYR